MKINIATLSILDFPNDISLVYDLLSNSLGISSVLCYSQGFIKYAEVVFHYVPEFIHSIVFL